jgi:membrane protease YdiL (CAAX protease family)
MLSEKPWAPDAVARLFLGVIASVCVGLMLAGLVQTLGLGLSETQRRLVTEIIMVIFFQIAAMFWIDAFLRQEGMLWGQAFGLANPGVARAIGLGVLSAVVFLPLAWGLQQLSAKLMTLLHLKPVAQIVVEQMQTNVPLSHKIFLGVLAIVVAPIAEESLFRGVLYPTLKQTGHVRLAMWGTSLIFGITHFNAVTFLPLTVFSVILVLLYEETDNLLAPIVAHSTFNTTNFVLLLTGFGQ